MAGDLSQLPTITNTSSKQGLASQLPRELLSAMALNISAAEQQDARRIAEIHMAAFATNAMLLAQFPSPTIREGLRECIARKALDDIEDPNIVVLVARDQDHNQIISFAKWSLPNPTGEGYEESPWRWPEGTQYGVLNEWTEKVESAKSNVLGDGPCYRERFASSFSSVEYCFALNEGR